MKRLGCWQHANTAVWHFVSRSTEQLDQHSVIQIQLRCIFKLLQVTWRWQPFHNPARNDDLKLEHWVKCYKDPAGKVRPADEGEYSFAKYNKKVI